MHSEFQVMSPMTTLPTIYNIGCANMIDCVMMECIVVNSRNEVEGTLIKLC